MKIYNMLRKHFVGNAHANMNCLLIFRNHQETIDHLGHYPKNLPRLFEADIGGRADKADIEIYLDKIERQNMLAC